MDVRSRATRLRPTILLLPLAGWVACAGPLPWQDATPRPADPSGLACEGDFHVASTDDDFGRTVVCEAPDGKHEGYEVRFDADGSLHTISVVEDDGEARTAISWRRPGGGVVQYEPLDEAGRGVWTEWTHGGQLLSRIEAKNGAMDGTAVWYYEDGTKRMRGRHEDDGMTGLWERWYPSGRIYSACEWSDGVQHGRCQVWDPGGTLRVDGDYDHGARSGEWKFWDSYGNPVRSPADLPARP